MNPTQSSHSEESFAVSVGNFFFKYRNSVFPALFAAMIVFARPSLLGGQRSLDYFLTTLGAIIALSGQFVRIFTIGFDYIERGGKEGKVYASRLVRGGVFSMTRNPMYLGNILIALGVSMMAGTYMILLIAFPFFFLVYRCIIAAEENFLLDKFGEDFEVYCREVPRLLPRVRIGKNAFEGFVYDWKKSIRKELSTMAGLFSGIILLPLWRVFWLEGQSAATDLLPGKLLCAILLWALYGFAVYLKKTKKFFF